MGNWKATFVITMVFSFFAGTCLAVTPCEREKALRRKGYSDEEIQEIQNEAAIKERMRQAKYGHYEEDTPWWPEDPRYPVPYLFYREGQTDFGFNRW